MNFFCSLYKKIEFQRWHYKIQETPKIITKAMHIHMKKNVCLKQLERFKDMVK